MAGLVIVRAVSYEGDPHVRISRRVHSSNLVDRLRPIPEDRQPTPSPSPRKYSHSGSEKFGFSGRHHAEVEETMRLLPKELESIRAAEFESVAWYRLFTVFLSMMTVLGMVSQVISMPLFTDAMSDPIAGSNAFISSFCAATLLAPLFFIMLMVFNFKQDPRTVFKPPAPLDQIAIAGILVGLNNILVAFTSLPDRTPTYLQGILHQMLIPFAALARYILLDKAITKRQMLCILVLTIGMIITLEPSFFKMRKFEPSGEPNPGAWYFYTVYAMSWLPLAFGFVIAEKNSGEGQSFAYMAWLQLFIFFAHFLFFWIDFIPHIGMAYIYDTSYLEKIQNGFQCFYGAKLGCPDVPRLAALYIVSYGCTTIFSILLIRYAEGAVFTTIVLALVTPLSSLFWSFFRPTPSFHWAPFFDLTTGFTVVGLLIMMPAVVMYTYVGPKDNGNTTTRVKTRYRSTDSESSNSDILPVITKDDYHPSSQVDISISRKYEDRFPGDVPIRYQAKPQIKRQRSWTVSYAIPERKVPPPPPPASLKSREKKSKKGKMRRSSSAPAFIGGF